MILYIRLELVTNLPTLTSSNLFPPEISIEQRDQSHQVRFSYSFTQEPSDYD